MRFNLVLIMSFALLVRNSLAIMLLYIYHYAYDQYLCFPDCGKITLQLLFGWSLDKDEKSLDQSKQFS